MKKVITAGLLTVIAFLCTASTASTASAKTLAIPPATTAPSPPTAAVLASLDTPRVTANSPIYIDVAAPATPPSAPIALPPIIVVPPAAAGEPWASPYYAIILAALAGLGIGLISLRRRGGNSQ